MPKIQKTVLNRVEGEIELKLEWENGKIKDVFIIASNFRGFEFILEGKPPLDALVITPRICGICGHAHLIATTNALEKAYENAGYPLEISQKAKIIRKLTLSAEIVQNHIRWFYLFVFPDILKLEKGNKQFENFIPIKGSQWRKALEYSSKIVKIISLFGGQWPHTSYSLPGGVVSDPTTFEIVEAIDIVDSLINYVEQDILGMNAEDYLSITDPETFFEKSDGDLKIFLQTVKKHNFHKIGKAYKRFLTVCEMNPVIAKGITRRKKCEFDINKVKEIKTFSYLSDDKNLDNKYSWATAVRYDGYPYETGPLARRINNQDPLFLNLLSEYKDSYFTRIWARVDEIIKLLFSMKQWLQEINLKEKSFIQPKIDIKELETEGYGTVEAARGSLIHFIKIKEGKIQKYEIITPSVWNLGTRCEKYLSPAEKAIKGLKSGIQAEMVLRSFDVCSVCTTH